MIKFQTRLVYCLKRALALVCYRESAQQYSILFYGCFIWSFLSHHDKAMRGGYERLIQLKRRIK